MKKLLAVFLTASLLACALPALAAEEVNVFNWEDYICDEVIDLFEEETGIKVNYMRFTTNEDMLVQVQADPKNYDVIFPSDYIIERLISEDLLEELDYSQLPNAQYTLDWLKTPDYDPEGKYSVPYMWGTVGILYNKTLVSAPITSWDGHVGRTVCGQRVHDGLHPRHARRHAENARLFDEHARYGRAERSEG